MDVQKDINGNYSFNLDNGKTRYGYEKRHKDTAFDSNETIEYKGQNITLPKYILSYINDLYHRENEPETKKMIRGWLDTMAEMGTDTVLPIIEAHYKKDKPGFTDDSYSFTHERTDEEKSNRKAFKDLGIKTKDFKDKDLFIDKTPDKPSDKMVSDVEAHDKALNDLTISDEEAEKRKADKKAADKEYEEGIKSGKYNYGPDDRIKELQKLQQSILQEKIQKASIDSDAFSTTGVALKDAYRKDFAKYNKLMSEGKEDEAKALWERVKDKYKEFNIPLDNKMEEYNQAKDKYTELKKLRKDLLEEKKGLTDKSEQIAARKNEGEDVDYIDLDWLDAPEIFKHARKWGNKVKSRKDIRDDYTNELDLMKDVDYGKVVEDVLNELKSSGNYDPYVEDLNSRVAELGNKELDDDTRDAYIRDNIIKDIVDMGKKPAEPKTETNEPQELSDIAKPQNIKELLKLNKNDLLKLRNELSDADKQVLQETYPTWYSRYMTEAGNLADEDVAPELPESSNKGWRDILNKYVGFNKDTSQKIDDTLDLQQQLEDKEREIINNIPSLHNKAMQAIADGNINALDDDTFDYANWLSNNYENLIKNDPDIAKRNPFLWSILKDAERDIPRLRNKAQLQEAREGVKEQGDKKKELEEVAKRQAEMFKEDNLMSNSPIQWDPVSKRFKPADVKPYSKTNTDRKVTYAGPFGENGYLIKVAGEGAAHNYVAIPNEDGSAYNVYTAEQQPESVINQYKNDIKKMKSEGMSDADTEAFLNEKSISPNTAQDKVLSLAVDPTKQTFMSIDPKGDLLDQIKTHVFSYASSRPQQQQSTATYYDAGKEIEKAKHDWGAESYNGMSYDDFLQEVPGFSKYKAKEGEDQEELLGKARSDVDLMAKAYKLMSQFGMYFDPKSKTLYKSPEDAPNPDALLDPEKLNNFYKKHHEIKAQDRFESLAKRADSPNALTVQRDELGNVVQKLKSDSKRAIAGPLVNKTENLDKNGNVRSEQFNKVNQANFAPKAYEDMKHKHDLKLMNAMGINLDGIIEGKDYSENLTKIKDQFGQDRYDRILNYMKQIEDESKAAQAKKDKALNPDDIDVTATVKSKVVMPEKEYVDPYTNDFIKPGADGNFDADALNKARKAFTKPKKPKVKPTY